MFAGTASIFIVADTNIYLHSLPLLERFMYHLGPSCGAVADLGSVGLQCAVIIPQVSSISMGDGEPSDDFIISSFLVGCFVRMPPPARIDQHPDEDSFQCPPRLCGASWTG